MDIPQPRDPKEIEEVEKFVDDVEKKSSSQQKKSGPIARIFKRGLAGLLPILITTIVFFQAFKLLEQNVSKPIFDATVWTAKQDFARDLWRDALGWDMEKMSDDELESKLNEQWWFITARWALTLFGPIVIVFVFGWLLAGFIGKRADGLISRLPVVKMVYPYAKQLTDFFFTERKVEYSAVVFIEYPRRGLVSLGFVTGRAMQEIEDKASSIYPDTSGWINLFVPSSPTPITGYTIMVPEKDVMTIDMTADQALRFCITAGVVMPQHQTLGQRAEEKRKLFEKLGKDGSVIKSDDSIEAIKPRQVVEEDKLPVNEWESNHHQTSYRTKEELEERKRKDAEKRKGDTDKK